MEFVPRESICLHICITSLYKTDVSPETVLMLARHSDMLFNFIVEIHVLWTWSEFNGYSMTCSCCSRTYSANTAATTRNGWKINDIGVLAISY